MNSEVEVLKTETIVFSPVAGREEGAEKKIVEVIKVEETMKNLVSFNNEIRFARLKKNLRKRSASIL